MGELDSTLGAVLIAGLLAAVLHGLTILQTFLYTQTSGSDGPLMRCLVLFLWSVDTLHTALISHTLYFYLVTNFGHIGVLAAPTWSIIVAIYLTSLTGIIVRIFLAYRLFLLCGRYRPRLRVALPAIVMIPTMITFLTGLIFASKAFIVRLFARLDTFSVYLYITFSAAALADTLIAVSLCVLLYRSRTGIEQTDSLLTTLIVMTINTGLLTSIFALLCLITYSIWPLKFIYVGMYFSLNKLYVNSLLGSLNARKILQAKQERSTHDHRRSVRSTRFEVVSEPASYLSPAESITMSGVAQKESFASTSNTLHQNHVPDQT
ncbi:hypothetical protein HYPSUDRAFT_207529 [Hypholoma sublateritium FD-334 SS-4]|uniref:DUF6534 domain-containing protein n=1 Tax=Hypholoma sublateritium (strain FD-334 SS-4) TaxID=945553 RepID=A0A0D2P611_HYPSF|nr:hypothetical protein HYPSUDRAFT_207529 [Hypholoma sublateritium FD-334 SS-4]